MKVVVTGGAGYIGTALVRNLLEKGNHIVSIDNLMRGDYRYLKELGEGQEIKLVVGDITEAEALKEAFNEADAVAHTQLCRGCCSAGNGRRRRS